MPGSSNKGKVAVLSSDHDEWDSLQWNAIDILTPIDGFDDHPLSCLTLAHTMLFVIHVKLGVFLELLL